MTPEEAEEAYDNSPAIPLSEDEINRIVGQVTQSICDLPTITYSHTKRLKHLLALPPQQVLRHTILSRDGDRKIHRKEYTDRFGEEWRVKMFSLRYDCFQKSLDCVCCGLQGNWMILDWHPSVPHSVHFNLYAEYDGKLVLLTKDHIHPRSKGGPDHVRNFQTFCTVCNTFKKDQMATLEEVREIPEIKRWIEERILPPPGKRQQQRNNRGKKRHRRRKHEDQ